MELLEVVDRVRRKGVKPHLGYALEGGREHLALRGVDHVVKVQSGLKARYVVNRVCGPVIPLARDLEVCENVSSWIAKEKGLLSLS